MSQLRFRYSLIVALLFLGNAATAQEPVDTVASIPGIEIKTSVDRAQILVGDRITYTVAIEHDTTIELIPPPLGANLGAFDVKDYEPDVTTELPGGRERTETIFKLSTFTTGEYVIPPLPVIFRMPDSSMKVMMAEGVPITVKSLIGSGATDSLDIKPLKAQFEPEHGLTIYHYLAGLLGLLVTAALVAWFFWRERHKKQAEYVDTREPWEIAYEDLAVLQQKKLVENGQFKAFYFELADIARAYFGRMYRRDALEMTTGEFAGAYADIELPGNAYERIMSFLRHADLVKFAEFQPDHDRPEQDFQLVHALISEVRDDCLARKEAEVHVNGEAEGSTVEEEQPA